MRTSEIIEAVLFYKGEPVSVKRLAQIIKKSDEETETGLLELEENLKNRGVILMRNNGEVMLGTSKDASSVIEDLIKEELHKDLGRAGLETLAIVLYLGPITRSAIDSIRGVNSNFILRNLLIRGLVQRVENPNDMRTFLYQSTFELLSFLGLKNIEALPEYESIKAEIMAKKKASEESMAAN